MTPDNKQRPLSNEPWRQNCKVNRNPNQIILFSVLLFYRRIRYIASRTQRVEEYLLWVRKIVVDLLVENVEYHIQKIPVNKTKRNESKP